MSVGKSFQLYTNKNCLFSGIFSEDGFEDIVMKSIHFKFVQYSNSFFSLTTDPILFIERLVKS